MDLGLTDKAALVTGSSRGLGLASAAALVEEGCRVAICARGRDALEAAAADLRRIAGNRSGRILPVAADISTVEGVEQVVARTVEAFGGLEHLVNNVGLAKGATITDTTDADWAERSTRRAPSGDPRVEAGRSPGCAARAAARSLVIASIWPESGGRMTQRREGR